MTHAVPTIDVSERPASSIKRFSVFFLVRRLFGVFRQQRHNTRSFDGLDETGHTATGAGQRTLGRHVLTERDDGSLRCVACFLCETACPAGCIHIEAEEVRDTPVEREKRPRVFEIDFLRCAFCGLCVDVCPSEALIMSNDAEFTFTNRPSAVLSIDRLRHNGPIEDRDLGYRPYY